MTGHAQWVDRSCISGKIEATEVKVGVNTNKATDNRSHNQADEVVSQIHRCLPHTAGDSLKRAEILNRHCSCRTLDPERLRRQLEGDPTLSSLYGEILTKRPHLFSATAVFITPEQQNTMATIVSAVESVVKRPTYQKEILARAPKIASLNFGSSGVFMGFDFHLDAQGPHLIEINTNAGGALLNAALARAQSACCEEMKWAFKSPLNIADSEDTFLSMFRNEWHNQHGRMPLTRIAIVDDDPENQYLYPEFQLFAHLFTRAGFDTVIANANELDWHNGELRYAGKRIDLVYNRLTDFYLEEPRHTALRQAHEAGAIVLSPHPRAHALYADKRNLTLLSDVNALHRMGVPLPERDILLTGIPQTKRVTDKNADHLWTERRGLFFKPANGYGSKATYRGDKLTRKVWKDILAGHYVAQAIAPPSERLTQTNDTLSNLKLDIRAYVYEGTIQLFAARLYAGQTTNFRTPGGGFAPVFVIPEN